MCESAFHGVESADGRAERLERALELPPPPRFARRDARTVDGVGPALRKQDRSGVPGHRERVAIVQVADTEVGAFDTVFVIPLYSTLYPVIFFPPLETGLFQDKLTFVACTAVVSKLVTAEGGPSINVLALVTGAPSPSEVIAETR